MFKQEAMRVPPPKKRSIASVFNNKLYFFNNNCYIGDMAHHINKLAFTLAEILITLGIIGVVAALTIPALIVKHQKKVFATKVKQTYAIVSNALISSVAENGSPSTWDYGESGNADGSTILNKPEHIKEMVKKYFKPYLKIIKEEQTASNYYIILSNGTTLTFVTDGSINDSNIYTPTALYIAASINNNTDPYASTTRDYSRKDFIMRVDTRETNARIKFFNWGGDTREKIKNTSKYACNKNIRKNLRYNCGALIQYDGWEIKNDYPW